ncbi:MAG: tetratricopeptide repeat protein [Alphaproteobacteria bacterium]
MSVLEDNLQFALDRFQAGRISEAASTCQTILESDPDNAAALNLMAVIALELGQTDTAINLAERTIALGPDVPAHYNVLGVALSQSGRASEAEAVFQKGLAMAPGDVGLGASLANHFRRHGRHEAAFGELQRLTEAHAVQPELYLNLGNTLREMGRLEEAASAYCRAIDLAPDDYQGYQNLGVIRVDQGEHQASIAPFAQALKIKRAVKSKQNPDAGNFVLASATKLRHDRDQLRYLVEQNILPQTFLAIAAAYEEVLDDLMEAGSEQELISLTPEQQAAIGDYYNRLLHYDPPGVCIGGALNKNLDFEQIARNYHQSNPNMVVFDDFLRPEALAGLYRFCRESTIWFDVRHPRGYIGAYIEEGFAMPLVLQIAEELGKCFPDVIGPHKLRKIWAYKYDSSQQAIRVHADEAAVNVNFWITPDDANQDPESGGLVVHTRTMPLSWDFQKYNDDETAIRDFLASGTNQPITVAHRQNRVVMFDSNVLHESDIFHFGDRYVDRRINVTMLFGQRG